MTSRGNTWALILAAGEGTRLRSLTTTRSGVAVPKQFCSLNGGASLLQEALHRASAVARPERICAVVAAQHRRFWEVPLFHLPDANVIAQPENRGTAHGILLPLLHIAARDPEATVVLLPADHHVEDEAAFAESLRKATLLASMQRDSVFLLGVEPDVPDTELGYILPVRGDTLHSTSVSRFVEKPAASQAQSLLDQGALWNVFVIAATARALLGMFERRMPGTVAQFREALSIDFDTHGMAVEDLYQLLPSVDFSRHIMEGQEPLLKVLPVPQCGWSDLGTPQRVEATLRRLPEINVSRPRGDSAMAQLSLAAQHASLALNTLRATAGAVS
ncbi:MAG: sugar phosphate nucleotidyltransferase [Steroidobacteraceae bacterium]